MRTGVNPHIYNAWQNMKRRCNDATNKEYYCYGARDITYTSDWEGFDNFNRDMEPTWFQGAWLDRADNNENYTKDNCRWVNKTVSSRNRNYVKITLAIAEEIRQLYSTGDFTQGVLAKRFDVSRQTIGYIVTGQSWL